MANEIIIAAYASALTITVDIYSNGSLYAGNISSTEVASTGVYQASVPNGTPYGKYLILAFGIFVEGRRRIGEVDMYWDGEREITPIMYEELHRIQGLNSSVPMSVTPTSRIAGDIELEITGNGVTSSTVTRQP